MTHREHLNSVLSKSVLLNTAQSAQERVRKPGDIQDSIILFFINIPDGAKKSTTV